MMSLGSIRENAAFSIKSTVTTPPPSKAISKKIFNFEEIVNDTINPFDIVSVQSLLV